MKKIKNLLMVLVYVVIFYAVQSVVTLAAPIYTFFKSLIEGTRDMSVLLNEFSVNAGLVTVNANFLIIVSDIITLLMFAVIILLRRRKLNDFIKMRKISLAQVIIAVFLTAALNLVAVYITSLDIFRDALPQYENTVGKILEGTPLATFLAVGIVAPAFEELMYRGVILRELRFSFSFHFANIIQALIFGVMHGNIVQGTYAAVIGFVLGIAYNTSGSIYFVMLVHIMFNMANILMASSDLYMSLPVLFIVGAVGCIMALYLLGRKNT